MLKNFTQKPLLVLFFIVAAYFTLYFTAASKVPPTQEEDLVNKIAIEFSQSGFFPKISLVRNVNDWGHVGYYVLAGRVAKFAGLSSQSDEQRAIHILRLLSLILSSLSFFYFVRLGKHYVSFNRLSPKWISLGLLIFAINPYSYYAATQAGHVSMLLLLMLAALFCFEKDDLRNAGILLSVAVLVDWRALLLAIVFAIMRLRATSSRLVMIDRVFSLLMPFLAALLPIIAWRGFVPEGEIRQLWDSMRAEEGLIHPEGYLYSVMLIPIYVIFFSWNWGFKARVRASKLGVIITLCLIPLYFIFPIQPFHWGKQYSIDVPFGLIDQLAVMIAGEYKNFLLFFPWLIGQYLFIQLMLRDSLEHTNTLKCFIVLFFASELVMAGFGGALGGGTGTAIGDYGFLLIVPALILFTLSEALIGEEGKII